MTNLDHTSDSDFEDLLSQFLDDRISDCQLDRFAEMIASDAKHMETYRHELRLAEALSINADHHRSSDRFVELLQLRLSAESQKFDFLHRVLDRSAVQSARAVLRRWAPIAGLTLAASIAIAFSAGLWTGRISGDPGTDGLIAEQTLQSAPVEPTDDSVAVFKRAVDAVWVGDDRYGVGDLVSASKMLHLRSGLVQLQFFRGATLTLKGPARFKISKHDEVMLYEGQAWAKVPMPARGFTVLTPETKIVDLGTEFGVFAAPGASTEVHVFDGLVELHDRSESPGAPPLHQLVTGQAISVSSNGKSSPLVDRVAKRPSESQLQRSRDQQIAEGYRRWRQWSEGIRLDPRVILYYTFEPNGGLETTLPNQAASQPSQLSDGAIIGCSWTEGRWPQKSALDFKRPVDRVRFHLDGEFDSVTVAAWVRVDGLDRSLSSLLLTDGWDKGELHWQFDSKGQFGLSVGGADGVAWRYTESLVDLTQLGDWIHVASVFDGNQKTVRHYFNGLPVPNRHSDRSPIKFQGRIRIGDAELCNWGRPAGQTSQAIRNFNGRMDEFLMMDVPLQDAEVLEIFEAGNPNL